MCVIINKDCFGEKKKRILKSYQVNILVLSFKTLLSINNFLVVNASETLLPVANPSLAN